MILFIVLAIIVLIFALISLLLIGSAAALFILVFGDLIVCVMLIVWLFRKIFKKKNKKN